MTAPAKTGLGEPVAIVSAIQAVLVLLVSFGKLDALGLHSQGDVALVVAVLAAVAMVYLAWSTHQTLLAPLVQVVQAGVALGVIYGLHLTTEQTGLVIAALTAVFGAFHRTQTSPLVQGNFHLAA
jgi:hypothetical protein